MGRYWDTLRYLRPIQLYGRVWFRLARPRVDLRIAPRMRSMSGPWVTPAPRPVSLIAPDRFTFLNRTLTLSDHGWDDPAVDKLWRYNLHYFDDLGAPTSRERSDWQRTLLSRWVADNPPGIGSGWEPYPTSLRIVNWIKWVHAGHTLSNEVVQSLAVQARWLSGRLETHLLGNHLFVNAKALVFAGLYFEGPEATRWLERGLRILRREVNEQILADGGQFELSPMYHAMAVEDMLDLVNVTRAYHGAIPPRWRVAIDVWQSRITEMRRWMLLMRHPDGEIAFFNDSAFGIATRPDALEGYASRLGLCAMPALEDGLTVLGASGYIRLDVGAAVALLDVASVGPDYLPAHAHADTLSFELSLFGQRVFVNSGTSRYGAGAERSRQRGTAAHNTVIVNGVDSSEVWGSFRVARRARPIGLSVTTQRQIMIRCAHDGYRHLPGRPEHLRVWSFADNGITVEDNVSGRVGRAEARFHLHPDVAIGDTIEHPDKSSSVRLRLPHGQIVRVHLEAGALTVVPSTWHPEFGREVTNRAIVVLLDGARSRVRVAWGSDA